MTTLAVGNRRLLKLADILDKADAAHKAKGEPLYDQQRFFHDCRTPACAIGHWIAHNPARWHYDAEGQPKLRTTEGRFLTIPDAQEEFALEIYDWNELFSNAGCGDAQTGKQAARYIRKFVKARS